MEDLRRLEEAPNAVLKEMFRSESSPEGRQGYKIACRLARQQKCSILKGT